MMGDMTLTHIDHLAFISHDLAKTIHFYRDLLGLPLTAALGKDGVRHYLFGLGASQIAFFAYDEAAPAAKKPHGARTAEPRGFDHVSFGVGSRADLFAWRDLLVAAGAEVQAPGDHGVAWSIYVFDPSGIGLEVCWTCLEAIDLPVIHDPAPVLPAPRPRPQVSSPTPPAEWRAKPGVGHELRETLIAAGRA